MAVPANALEQRRVRVWLLPVGIGVGYLALSQGLSVLTGGNYLSPTFWPAAGVALGALLITPRRRWPAILVAVFVAAVISNLLFRANVMAISGWALANVLNPWIAASLIRRFHPRFDLRSPAQLAAFVAFAGVVGPAVSAVVGTATSVAWWDGSWSTLGGWWVGDGLGALVIAPLFVAFQAPELRRSLTEFVVGGGLLVAAILVVFRNWDSGIDMALPYLVLPPLVWVAFRFGLPGAAVGIAALGILGGWSTPLGYGPFATTSDFNAIVLFQLYLGVLATTALLIAALVADVTERKDIQREAERRQRQQTALAQLGQRVLRSEHPDDVLAQLGDALRVIGERPAPDLAIGTSSEEPTESAVDPWEPLAAHQELLRAHAFVDRHPVEGDAVALATSATTVAASALDRIEQESRLRERAEELEDLNARLARAIGFREQLVSMVSHELRSPLTPILGFTDMLRRSLAGGPDIDRGLALDAIERNARRILTLIDELLLSARAADGRLVVTPEHIDVGRMVKRTLEDTSDDVSVVVDSPEPLVAWVDPGHLAQCVTNLISNAVKYGAPPIVVCVRAESPERVTVEVIDHGDGVPDAMVPVLFDRFTQGGKPVTGASGGVGLGLSIVRTLVEANAGTVAYQPPHDGSPSTFVLRLPRSAHD